MKRQGRHPNSPPGTGYSGRNRLAVKTTAILNHWAGLAALPATDQQLDQIWPAWNALPSDMLPEEKERILTLDETNDYARRSQQFGPFQRLRRQFSHLPLDRHAYHQALNKAHQWASLLDFLHSTEALHKGLVQSQLSFRAHDNHAFARVAIYRAAQEINIMRPALLKAKAPKLADIAYLQDRYDTYTESRQLALEAVSNLVFKIPGMRTGTALPFDERAYGVPHPPEDVPRHLFLARLDALGICSAERLIKFLRSELPTFDREKRHEFYSMSLKSRHGKEPYASFLVWVLDNRPIFEHEDFPWQWRDIQAAADEKGIDCPRTGLKQWASRHKLAFRLKRGTGTIKAQRDLDRSKPLLTPAPVFGDTLKPSTR